jgi:hypothetical protein
MKSTFLFVLCCAALLGIAGCSRETTVGNPEPKSTAPVALQEIYANPALFHEKTVVLKGVVTGQCGALCEFTYTEKGRSAVIFMGALKAPRIKTGTPVRLSAKVFSGEKQVVLTATGFILLSKGEQG